MKSSNKGKDFCVFALPGLFCFLAVVMVPFIYGIYLTLTDWNGVSSVKNFVGLSNFAAVMRDAQFWKSLLLTFKYVIAVVVLVNVIAFLLAYILTRGIKGQNFFRAGFFTEPDRRYRTWIHLAVRILPCFRQHRRDHRMEPV